MLLEVIFRRGELSSDIRRKPSARWWTKSPRDHMFDSSQSSTALTSDVFGSKPYCLARNRHDDTGFFILGMFW